MTDVCWRDCGVCVAAGAVSGAVPHASSGAGAGAGAGAGSTPAAGSSIAALVAQQRLANKVGVEHMLVTAVLPPRHLLTTPTLAVSCRLRALRRTVVVPPSTERTACRSSLVRRALYGSRLSGRGVLAWLMPNSWAALYALFVWMLSQVSVASRDQRPVVPDEHVPDDAARL